IPLTLSSVFCIYSSSFWMVHTEHRTLYCDLKHQNILIAPSGHLCLAEFSLSAHYFDGPEMCAFMAPATDLIQELSKFRTRSLGICLIPPRTPWKLKTSLSSLKLIGRRSEPVAILVSLYIPAD
ncbi:hypothetical protein C8R45DRAFT_979410, partial [Mycena sanguinolenta]